MGRPPQRAARLYFRAPGISGEDAHGPGSFEYWRARADGTGKRSAGGSCSSCGLARAKRRAVRGKPSSCGRRFAVSSVANFQTDWIAFPCKSSHSSTGGGWRIAGAKRVTDSEADWIASAGGLSCDVAVSSTAK
jgi:hypothetical protein